MRAAAIAAVAFVLLILAMCGERKEQARHAAMDKVPTNITHAGAGSCPAGWRRIERYFTEKDGSRRPACIDEAAIRRTGVFAIDVLWPGEEAPMGSLTFKP